MTTPEEPTPQPRDIALEEATPDQVQHLEEQSDPETGADREGTD